MTVESVDAAEMIQDARRQGWAEGFSVGNEQGYCNGYEMALVKLDKMIASENNSVLRHYLTAFLDALRLAGPNLHDPEGM
jgi:flagellar biosynthesis/type III secretory pathway protein FliH